MSDITRSKDWLGPAPELLRSHDIAREIIARSHGSPSVLMEEIAQALLTAATEAREAERARCETVIRAAWGEEVAARLARREASTTGGDGVGERG